VNKTTDHTRRRTIAEAMRVPEWRELIESVHAGQEAAGYDGRQFGPDEMRFFGATLVGTPWPLPYSRRVYWVERTSLLHSDESTSVRYALKVWDGDTPAKVETIAEEFIGQDPTPEVDDMAARVFVERAAFQIGVTL
jgi:hypothetical protein